MGFPTDAERSAMLRDEHQRTRVRRAEEARDNAESRIASLEARLRELAEAAEAFNYGKRDPVLLSRKDGQTVAVGVTIGALRKLRAALATASREGDAPIAKMDAENAALEREDHRFTDEPYEASGEGEAG